MGSINNMIQWFKDREGKVSYSQDGRLGPNSYDCSSAVYFALIAGGFIPEGSMGWTGSLHDTTLPPIAKKISRSECRRGDIFLSKYWANDGHTGVFLDNSTIIHCNAYDNNIRTTVADGRMGPSPTEYYRLNDTNDENIPDTESEEMLMWVFYQANKNAPVRWFNGEHAYAIGHADEMKAIQQIYKANTGKDVPFLTNWTDATPYHNRLANVLNRKPDF
ncbi:hypothetical protein IGK30_003237 [Enterococcus sp. AZ178]|uniref:peptidoglycan amidohydrolase family protein n=1 Tax=Enterococcus sp. AZ178 TaxID=2774822 RepID=UPI003F2753B8